MDVTQMTTEQRAEALVGLALAEHVDDQHREREAREYTETVRQNVTRDAATWAAEYAFERAASDLTDWTVSPTGATPEGLTEAVMTLPCAPYAVRLVFRAEWGDGNPDTMAERGALFVQRDCYGAPCHGHDTHVTRVQTLAELGKVLSDHGAYDLDAAHPEPSPPPEWSNPSAGREK
ncbi:hypothetical protein ABT033_37785 [Streptomyces pharetrae]|uniref:hypothetical protein n=1 Tax=Streptomyces pharetrae TaxID=291370 RepID=UPI00336431D6